jgi:hypothetical protein
MSTGNEDHVIQSNLSDIRDLPLDAEVNVDDVEYWHSLRRIGTGDGEPGTTVSTFNSSI